MSKHKRCFACGFIDPKPSETESHIKELQSGTAVMQDAARCIAAKDRRIDELEGHIAKQNADNSRLREAVDAFTALINESGGVYGLHLNGDLAPWDELMAGGRFEEWLLPLALLGGGDE